MELFLQLLQQLCFVAALVAVGLVLNTRIRFIKRNILLGKPVEKPRDKAKSFKNMLLLAFGQKKMFDRPFVGLMHFVLYAGFLVINIEVLEIVLDGILGTHRLFAPLFGSLYPVLINTFEFLAFGVVFTCVVFWLRRNVLKIRRFHQPEMKGWPARDANIILVWECVLMFMLYTMNATDGLLQLRAAESAYVAAHYPQVGMFAFSQWLAPLYEGLGTSNLILAERISWWLHILGIMGFAVYVTYSKHLHIFMAFPNTYFAAHQPKGEMDNMPAVTKEVRIALGLEQDPGGGGEIPVFGAKDVKDLTWKNLMDAYACTECGRCTAACPANMTGKKLSPRKIMMDVRDRMEDLGHFIDSQPSVETDGKTLYGDYTTKEELMACTTCNACVEACPVGINPLDIILQQRRYVAMELSATPASWNAMFANVENNQAPWAFPASDRDKWMDRLS